MIVEELTVTAKSGLRERQRRERGETILQAAFALLAEKGYDALTMEELAERVGISRQTLYHHFASKEDIALRAVMIFAEEGIQSIRSIDPQLPPIDRLERVVRWMMEVRFTPTRAAFVKARPILMHVKASPEYREAFDRRARAIQEIADAAIEAGQIEPGLSSAMVVQVLLALICDPSYEQLVDSGKATPEEIASSVALFFRRGVERRKDAIKV
ncbi:MAG: transcriptional regulator, TetR family [Capsulimonas sp.]|nr:transcriptional regulator, TetR family [Capsulimonas sp.]